MIKGIFFDFDGVIVDSEVHHTGITETFFKNEGINIPIEATYAMIGGNTKMNQWKVLYDEYRSEFKESYESFYKRHHEFFVKTINETDYSTIMFPDVYDVLKRLKEKGYFLALCSSSPMAYLVEKLKECKIDVFFDIVLSGENFKKSKPDPDIYLTCLKMSGLNKDEVVVVEDSPFGIKAAKNAGLEVYARKDYIFGLDQSETDHFIDTFIDLYEDLHS